MRDRFDTYWYGLILGLILPALFCVVYLDNYNLWHMMRLFGQGANPIVQKLLMLSVFPDLAALFLFYSMDMWKLAKGILLGCFPYMIASAMYSL
ncbi:MAG: hypothetical protein MJZ89_02480 [Paludibacteraceae bacterium]|nr:hypothetical protein [Paludibacteraceae bacterium]